MNPDVVDLTDSEAMNIFINQFIRVVIKIDLQHPRACTFEASEDICVLAKYWIRTQDSSAMTWPSLTQAHLHNQLKSEAPKRERRSVRIDLLLGRVGPTKFDS